MQTATGPSAKAIQLARVFRALGELTSKPRLILELRDKAGILPSVEWLRARNLAR